MPVLAPAELSPALEPERARVQGPVGVLGEGPVVVGLQAEHECIQEHKLALLVQ